MPTPQHWFELPQAPSVGTPLGQRDDLPDGVATLVALDTGADPTRLFRLLLLRSGAQVSAFVNRCPHFGVPLAAKQTLLLFKPHTSITCNVHYARFRWSDGVCEAGECLGEGLIPVPLVVSADGLITIAGPAT